MPKNLLKVKHCAIKTRIIFGSAQFAIVKATLQEDLRFSINQIYPDFMEHKTNQGYTQSFTNQTLNRIQDFTLTFGLRFGRFGCFTKKNVDDIIGITGLIIPNKARDLVLRIKDFRALIYRLPPSIQCGQIRGLATLSCGGGTKVSDEGSGALHNLAPR